MATYCGGLTHCRYRRGETGVWRINSWKGNEGAGKVGDGPLGARGKRLFRGFGIIPGAALPTPACRNRVWLPRFEIFDMSYRSTSLPEQTPPWRTPEACRAETLFGAWRAVIFGVASPISSGSSTPRPWPRRPKWKLAPSLSHDSNKRCTRVSAGGTRRAEVRRKDPRQFGRALMRPARRGIHFVKPYAQIYGADDADEMTTEATGAAVIVSRRRLRSVNRGGSACRVGMRDHVETVR
jgi:hypothetical protein